MKPQIASLSSSLDALAWNALVLSSSTWRLVKNAASGPNDAVQAMSFTSPYGQRTSNVFCSSETRCTEASTSEQGRRRVADDHHETMRSRERKVEGALPRVPRAYVAANGMLVNREEANPE